MSNFAYSVNATLPVFLVMVAGWLLRRRGMLNDNFVKVANDFNFKVTLPVLLFSDISKSDIHSIYDGPLVLFCILSTLGCIAFCWVFALIFVKDKSQVGSFIQGAFRGGVASLGLAIMNNIYGNSSVMPLIIAVSAPLYNVFSVLILTLHGSGQAGAGKGQVRQVLRGIVTNPIIIGIALGMAASLLEVPLPALATKTLSNFANMATPLALVAIGAGFDLGQAQQSISTACTASVIKLILQPALCLPVAVWMGFEGPALVALLIMLGAPTTPSSYIMSVKMGNDGPLASSIIVITTLFSAITVTFFVYVLRSLALI